MKMGEKGLKLVKSFEGLYLKAYKCPAGVWTIGYGHTGKVNGKAIGSGMKITEKTADQLLRNDMKEFEKVVRSAVKVKINQNQFDALVSFAFNCGAGALRSSTILKMVNQKKFITAARHFEDWSKATVNGKKVVLAGLLRRRKAEAALFSTGIPSKVSTYSKNKLIADLETIKKKKAKGKTGVVLSSFISSLPTIGPKYTTNHEIIKYVKKYLKKLGYFKGTINTKYDKKLANAIKKYKIAKQIDSTNGLIGSKVWKSLL